MSTLAERLAAMRQAQQPGAVPVPRHDVAEPSTSDAPVAGKRRATPAPVETDVRVRGGRGGSADDDRLDEVRAAVHGELLKTLGPQLYEADLDQDELDQELRTILADVLGA